MQKPSIDLSSMDPAAIEAIVMSMMGDSANVPPAILELVHAAGIELPAEVRAKQAEALRTLGLESSVRDLKEKGYTVVPNAFPHEMADRIREGILRAAAEDEADGIVTMGAGKGPTGTTVFRLLERGRVFEEAVMNPVVIALMRNVLGDGFTLSTLTGMVRPKGNPQLPLHTDNQYMPAPFTSWQVAATAVWYLDDLTAEAGASRVVPNSTHRLRHPEPGEGENEWVAIEAPKGSLVMWNGNTWHGNCARQVPGERVTLHAAFIRMHIRPFERYDELPQEVLDRNPPLFAQLAGRTFQTYGFDRRGPQQLAMLKARLMNHVA